MKLYEFEGHRILAKAGIESPFFVVCANIDEVKEAKKRLKFPIVGKVQVLSGRRGKGGGVRFLNSEKQMINFAKEMFGNEFGTEKVQFISFSAKVEIVKEYYVSITYDTARRIPNLLFCEEGGVDIEQVKRKDPEKIKRVDIDPLTGPKEKDLIKIFNSLIYSSGDPEQSRRGVEKFPLNSSRLRSNNIDNLIDFCLRLWDVFSRFDCRLIEVNPIGLTRDGQLVAIDAKIILDDAGLSRHRDLDILPKGAVSAIPTDREILAKKIDENDYRGSAGSTFIEFDDSPRGEVGLPRGEVGDIAILASGGGASLLVMDSVIDAGGHPANYTEYSGNPPAEKVEKLTKLTLSCPNLTGCLVAGAVANFTDIYETLRGFAEGLRQVRPKPIYPIVIRRGGSRQEEAYEMLTKVAKKEGFDIHLFGPETPISVACQKMVELSEQFKVQPVLD